MTTKSQAIELAKTAESLSALAMSQLAKIKRLQAKIARLERENEALRATAANAGVVE